MAKKQTVNRWKEYYKFLTPEQQKELREQIMVMLNLSLTTFYRKLDNTALLSPSDKNTIANLSNVPVHFLFPELENA